MARKPKFKYTKTTRGWCVNIPATVSATGKRERCYFSTRDEAKEYASELAEKYHEHGANSAGIKPALAEDATAAAAMLKPYGKSLVDAARALVATLKANDVSETTGAAVDAWIDSCGHLRPITLRSYGETATRIKNALPARILNTIKPDELAKAVGFHNATGSSAAMHYRNARAFWNFSAKREWCDAKLFEKIEAPKVRKGIIEILTVAEAETILRTAEKHFPQFVAHFALSFFAGIRKSELARLSAKDVSPDGIEIRTETSKTDSRRFITPSDTLKAWLAAYPFKPSPEWETVEPSCRYLAGWKTLPKHPATIKANPVNRKEFDTRPEWKQNAIRHSHATYAVAYGISLQDLLFEFGHTESPTMLRRHYKGAATKKQAIEYFSILPSKTATTSKAKSHHLKAV